MLLQFLVLFLFGSLVTIYCSIFIFYNHLKQKQNDKRRKKDNKTKKDIQH